VRGQQDGWIAFDNRYRCLCPLKDNRWLWNFNVLNWSVKLEHFVSSTITEGRYQNLADFVTISAWQTRRWKKLYVFPPTPPPPKKMTCDWTFAIILLWSPHEYYTEIAHLYLVSTNIYPARCISEVFKYKKVSILQHGICEVIIGMTFDINPLNTKRRLLYLKTQFVPRSKHFSSRL
jgi:hypothetical protein